MVIALPTLSSFGWVTNPPEKIDFLMAHLFTSMKSQTSLYGNNVSSMQHLLEDKMASMDDTAAAMRSTIITYLRRYYETANVDVKYKDEDPQTSSSRVQFSIAITVVEAGVEYQVSKQVSIIDGRFKDFINLNNQE